MEAKPVSEQIAASIEDVQQLLADNRSLSVALLARLVDDLRKELRERFETIQRDPRVDALEERVEKQKQSLLDARVKFHKMQQDLDELRKPKEPAQPNDEECFG